jgi:hypothetical protein
MAATGNFESTCPGAGFRHCRENFAGTATQIAPANQTQ